MGLVKRFTEWLGLKQKLHNSAAQAPFFKEGEVWWCALGENIGTEMSGKGKEFLRPVLIFKKFDSVGFFGIPLSRQKRVGSWYVSLRRVGEEDLVVVLNQARFFNSKRLRVKMFEVGIEDFQEIRHSLSNLYFK